MSLYFTEVADAAEQGGIGGNTQLAAERVVGRNAGGKRHAIRNHADLTWRKLLDAAGDSRHRAAVGDHKAGVGITELLPEIDLLFGVPMAKIAARGENQGHARGVGGEHIARVIPMAEADKHGGSDLPDPLRCDIQAATGVVGQRVMMDYDAGGTNLACHGAGMLTPDHRFKARAIVVSDQIRELALATAYTEIGDEVEDA